MAVKTKSAAHADSVNGRRRTVNPVVRAIARRKYVSVGEHIESDPRVQGGELVFKGSRIMVRNALELLAAGYTLDEIPPQWASGKVTREAVIEAIRLALSALNQVYETPPPYDGEA